MKWEADQRMKRSYPNGRVVGKADPGRASLLQTWKEWRGWTLDDAEGARWTETETCGSATMKDPFHQKFKKCTEENSNRGTMVPEIESMLWWCMGIYRWVLRRQEII